MNIKCSDTLTDRVIQLQRGRTRAAVLGVNDGLVSVLCLILGFAGSNATQHTVIIAGLSGLLAGAFSMATGEWISVHSQVGIYKGILNDLNVFVLKNKNVLLQQLESKMNNYGLMINLNNCISDELTWNDESLKEVYSKLVMGFNPEELGSPILAALSSFLLFVTGAIGPILPWLCFSGIKATITSVLITVTIGICVGGYVSYSSGKKIWKGAIEQVLIIGLSSIVTYGLGYILR